VRARSQHWFTNRFQGSLEASRAEEEFYMFVSRYHIKRVRNRLLITAFALTLSAIEPLTAPMPEIIPYLILHTIVPVFITLLAAALCFIRRTRPYWRIHVVVAGLGAYNAVLWSDAVIDVSGWSAASQDFSTLLQCVWVIIFAQYFALRYYAASCRIMPSRSAPCTTPPRLATRRYAPLPTEALQRLPPAAVD
jgi:hypothetical protein